MHRLAVISSHWLLVERFGFPRIGITHDADPGYYRAAERLLFFLEASIIAHSARLELAELRLSVNHLKIALRFCAVAHASPKL